MVYKVISDSSKVSESVAKGYLDAINIFSGIRNQIEKDDEREITACFDKLLDCVVEMGDTMQKTRLKYRYKKEGKSRQTVFHVR